LPKLFAGKPDNYEFRIWVTACSSGEEAYSIAILFKEAIEKTGKPYNFQIFATDLDESSVNRARDGRYPISIAADVSPIRLERFFKLDDNQYRISKEIRGQIIFATQNLIQDPPFTSIDLITCRNLLIYLNTTLQKDILPQFHYALKEDGILFLGSSESIGHCDHLFSVIDKKWKIYRRKTGQVSFPLAKLSLLPMDANLAALKVLNSRGNDSPTGNIVQQIKQLLLERFAPVSVIVKGNGNIVYIHGRTGKYLEPSSGQPNWNIVEMAREGLRLPLTASLTKMTKNHETETANCGLRVKTNGAYEIIDMTLSRVTEPEALRDLFLVYFLPQQPKAKAVKQPADKAHKTLTDNDKSDEKRQLEQELHFTKESLRTTIEELQTSNEEIRSANEELQSTNEELQSSNEELQTAKEEMQSLNEELNTINSELQDKVEQLSDSNDDLQNLMNGTDIATIFLDTQLRIKRFTHQAKNIFNLIGGDLGRPLGDLVSNLKYDSLMADAEAVLQTLVFKDAEVQTLSGDWYLLRILPYRTAENMIDGLVMTFVDINRLKKAEQTAKAAEITTAIVNTIHQPLLVLDEQLCILASNPSYNHTFNYQNEALVGQSLFSIHAAAWDSQVLRGHLHSTFSNAIAFDGFDYETEFPGIGKKRLVINGRMLKQSPGSPVLILLGIDNAVDKEHP